MSNVTKILHRIEQGDAVASEELLPLVYEELRKLAADKIRHEPPGQTLQATALVHEAYVKLTDGQSESSWDSRGHFFAAAAEAMRRLMIDRARRKKTEKHGGHLRRVSVDSVELAADSRSDELLALDEAVDRLAEIDPVKADLVKLRYFAGLTNSEAAAAMGIGVSTAERYWAYARCWLRSEISRATDLPPKS